MHDSYTVSNTATDTSRDRHYIFLVPVYTSGHHVLLDLKGSFHDLEFSMACRRWGSKTETLTVQSVHYRPDQCINSSIPLREVK
jgi:hypothetical protein